MLCSSGDGRRAVRTGLCRPCYDSADHPGADRSASGEGGRLPPVRLPADEVAAVAVAAGSESLTVAEWIRRAVRSALDARRV